MEFSDEALTLYLKRNARFIWTIQLLLYCAPVPDGLKANEMMMM